MKIIHHFTKDPRTNYPHITTRCNTPVAQATRGSYTLGDAIKRLDYSPTTVLCNECFHEQVGNIRFSNVPTYNQALHSTFTHGMVAPEEIVDVEEI